MARLSKAVAETMLLAAAAAARAQAVPTVPGDYNLDWSIDFADMGSLVACLRGPDIEPPANCTGTDLDNDGAVTLLDFAELQTLVTGTQLLSVPILSDFDDGTEVSHVYWEPDGYNWTGINRMGVRGCEFYDVGLRFCPQQVEQGEQVAYARLVLPGTGDGQVDSAVSLQVVGIDQDSAAPFYIRRPSHLPKTTAAVDWVVPANWPDPQDEFTCTPLQRYSPDLAPILNEILARPNWGCGSYGKVLALVIEHNGSAGTNFVCCHDYDSLGAPCGYTPVRPVLELYRTARATFVGKELLSCPTDHSVVVTALSLLSLEVYLEYRADSDVGMVPTPSTVWQGGEPIQIMLDDLQPDTLYRYRLRYRRPLTRDYESGPLRSFRTARPTRSTFSFTVVSDSHVQMAPSPALYQQTLRNVLADGPDFHIDLGDTFENEMYTHRDALDYAETLKRDLDQRAFLDCLCHSAPFFLVLGNHEAEQGWRLDGTPDNLAIWATLARQVLFPLPSPDDFYSGNAYPEPYVDLRQDYYAWQWGDALFVVLDPFWYTTTKPHDYGGAPGSGDNWDWTLGWAQYDWLRTTLQQSRATYKFVFAHHVTGGVNTYGRGGIEAARYAVAHFGSFEWGGEDAAGDYFFDTRRVGWGVPIHQLLVDNQATIFFHGHDHVFVKQELDGVVYQECPQPDDPRYSSGLYLDGHYTTGDKVNNSGHLRVTVAPERVTVEYVRAYLPGDGFNGAVAYAYTVVPPRR